MQQDKTLSIIKFGILLAIEAVFCFTPLGVLPTPGPLVATLAMIPTIMTALLLGPRAGSLMGAFSGLFSLIVWTFIPPPQSRVIAFVFTPFYTLGEFQGNFYSLLISFVPRILVGTVAGLSYQQLLKIFDRNGSKISLAKDVFCLALSAILGSLTNTFGVLSGIVLFFGEQYVALASRPMFSVAVDSMLAGGMEALVAAVVATVCRPIKMVLEKNNR